MKEVKSRPTQHPSMGFPGVESAPVSSNGTATTTTTTRTILRIKRRRTDAPIPCIRLEGLVNNNTGSNNDESMANSYREEEEGFLRNDTAKRQRSSCVLWKRYDPSDGNPANHMGNGGIMGNGSHHEDGEKYRIVDAKFLESDGENEEGDEGNNNNISSNNLRSTKRRKLTLLDSSTIADELPSNPKSPASSPSKKKKRSKALKVLDPMTRIVDDSLQEVLVGQKTIESHYRQLTTDPRFTMRNLESQTKWMTWSLDGGSNLMHCCALWNDASIANELLQRFGGSGSVRSALMEAVDGDGRTPYEIAQLIGHDRVCEVLEVYGGDTINYVYDVFYLDNNGLVKTRPDPDGTAGWEGGGSGDSDEGPGITTAELTSGIGYWTPEGELVLETADHEKRARSDSQETEGDIDSNCEEYGGNDYPDEEEYHHEDPLDDYGMGQGSNNIENPYAPSYNNPYHNEYGNGSGGGSGGYDNDDDDDGYVEYDWEEDLP